MRNRTIFSFTAVLIVLLSCFLTAPIWADVLDATFGEDGVVTTSLDHYGDAAKAVIIDKNNRILVAGVSANGSNFDFSLARYNENGTLDKTFNSDGVVTTQIGSDDDHAQAIALQENGKIVVAGYTSNGLDTDFALVRYNSDGSLDLGFGLGGIVVLPIGSGNDIANAVAVQGDGSILIAGSASGTTGRVAAIARIQKDGSLDHSFGYEGVVFSGSGRDTTLNDVLIQEDGAIVVTGQYRERDGATLLLMRYLPSGRPDLEFGLAGAVDTAAMYSAETAGTSVCLQENGAILIAGSTGSGNSQDIALFRFLPHGQYDPSFGTKGMVAYDINHEADGAYDIVATPDGIVVGGYTTMNGLRDFVLLKYSFAGVVLQQEGDADEGQESSLRIAEPVVEQTYTDSQVLREIEAANNPKVTVTTTSISSFDDTGYGIAVQKDYKIILVGSSGDEGVNSYALARYSNKDSAALAQKSGEATNPFIITTEVTEITRNSAFTGGTILAGSGLSFTSRGVVFSIVPFPVLTAGGSDGGGGDGGDGGDGGSGDVGPVRSNGQPTGVLDAGTTETTLSVNTDVIAECRFKLFAADLTFDTMTPFTTTNATLHSVLITGLTDGGNVEYSVRCKGTDGVVNEQNFNIPFSVGVAAKISKTYLGTKEAQSKTVAAPTAAAKVTVPGATDPVEGGQTDDGAGVGRFGTILNDLSIDTIYYVRAYGVTSDGLIFYGNQLTFETKDACFIATAAYGSLAHPHVTTLRTFRDMYLRPFALGRTVIDTYYRYSPVLARAIEQHPVLRPAVRVLLLPFIGLSYVLTTAGDLWIVFFIGLSGLFLISGWLRVRAKTEAF
jgi:uncharacterized delta-60 repeat protein